MNWFKGKSTRNHVFFSILPGNTSSIFSIIQAGSEAMYCIGKKNGTYWSTKLFVFRVGGQEILTHMKPPLILVQLIHNSGGTCILANGHRPPLGISLWTNGCRSRTHRLRSGSSVVLLVKSQSLMAISTWLLIKYLSFLVNHNMSPRFPPFGLMTLTGFLDKCSIFLKPMASNKNLWKRMLQLK